MPFQIDKVTEWDDFRRVIEVELDAYKEPLNTFVEIMRGPTVEETAARQWQWYRNTPESHWIKVTNTETGEIIGGAEWVVHEQNPYEKPGPEMTAYWWPENSVLQTMANQILGTYMSQRPVRMSRPHVLLNICFVEKKSRRKGAGRLLVKYGMELADRLGLDTFIEATGAGRPLYESMGFHAVDSFHIDVHTDHPTPEWIVEQQRICPKPFQIWFMWKPPGKEYVEGQTAYPWEESNRT